jgi:hypothetical protein
VALLGFVALAIDIGMVACARTQCQAAADAAAMAGARTLNGDVSNNNNFANAGPAVVTMATADTILNNPIQASWVSYEIGYYTYDRTTDTFGILLPSSGQPMPTGENWSLVTATINYNSPTTFGRVFGINSFNVTAMATAAHRPRDVGIIIDLSGSMSFDSLLGSSYSGTRTQSNNPETVYPQFGHYSAATWNPTAATPYVLSDGEVLGKCNLTTTTNAGPPLANDYYQNAFGGSPLAAFTAQPATYNTAPDGDLPLRKNWNASGQAFATNVADINNGSTALSLVFDGPAGLGYDAPALNTGHLFAGYTTGPSYWGKTFFIWPPNPDATLLNGASKDWRKRFFLKGDKTTPVDDNSLLWNTTSPYGVRAPVATGTTGYYINYAAIIRWLVNTGPNPFPTQLRAGRIAYYTAIPDVSNTANDSALNGRMYVAAPTDVNERFWKQYIDFVLGFQQNGTTYSNIASQTGYGAPYAWGTKIVHAKPTLPDTRYMDYTDNPTRPQTNYWFGPMTMMDFIDNYNLNQRWMPGTAHQAPSWGCKIGMRAAILDIENNHPNDYVCLSFFNTPEYSAGDGGKFNRIRQPLGHNYTRMVDLLFFPMTTVDNPGTEINVFDSANMLEVPHAGGSTTPAMSFMHMYNQFATSTALQTYNSNPGAPLGDAGGLGRKGAQKVIIFETDGVANTPANAGFQNNGPYTSYYKIRVGPTTEYPANNNGSFSGFDTQLYDIVQHICNQDNASVPGYSTPRRPVLVHSIAYGSLFDPSVASSSQAQAERNFALAILQQCQYIGSTQSDPATPLQSYKIITGTATQRISLIQQCFTKIMEDQVAVSLLQ